MHVHDIRIFAATATVAIALSSACTPARVHLVEPPSKSAPMEERVEYYEEHRPVAVRSSLVASRGWGTSTGVSFTVLEDGTRVDNPEDLLQVVEPTSPTAIAVTRASEAETEVMLWNLGLIGGVSVGLALVIGSLVPLAFAMPTGAPSGEPQYGGALADLSLGMALVGGLSSLVPLALLPGVLGASTRANKERETAFLTLDRSMRERLDLVEYGKEQRQAKRGPLLDSGAEPTPPELDLEPR